MAQGEATAMTREEIDAAVEAIKTAVDAVRDPRPGMMEFVPCEVCELGADLRHALAKYREVARIRQIGS
jgi:hypothetical protein